MTSKVLLLTIFASGIAVILVSLTLQKKSNAPISPTPSISPSNTSKSTPPPIAAPSPASYTGTLLAGTNAPYIEFNESDYQTALATNKLIILYFYADWCPICREEQQEITNAFTKLTSNAIVAFRVNYKDNETNEAEIALARQFGIAYQHTKVFLQNGQRILKSPEPWNEAHYLSEIEKALQ